MLMIKEWLCHTGNVLVALYCMLICFWLDLNGLYPWEPERIRPWQTMPKGRHSYVHVPSGERPALPSCKPHCTWRYSRWTCECAGTKQGTSGQILARMGRRVCQFLFLNLFNCYNEHFRVAVTSASKRVSERTFHTEMSLFWMFTVLQHFHIWPK